MEREVKNLIAKRSEHKDCLSRLILNLKSCEYNTAEMISRLTKQKNFVNNLTNKLTTYYSGSDQITNEVYENCIYIGGIDAVIYKLRNHQKYNYYIYI